MAIVLEIAQKATITHPDVGANPPWLPRNGLAIVRFWAGTGACPYHAGRAGGAWGELRGQLAGSPTGSYKCDNPGEQRKPDDDGDDTQKRPNANREREFCHAMMTRWL